MCSMWSFIRHWSWRPFAAHINCFRANRTKMFESKFEKDLLLNIHKYHKRFQIEVVSSCLHRASTVSKHFLLFQTDAHNYKIIGMLKTIKIPTIAPTCFGSRRNHHQGAISCLAKTIIMIVLCSSLMTLSMLWRHMFLLFQMMHTIIKL